VLHAPPTSLSSSLCSFLHSPVTSSLLGPNIHFPPYILCVLYMECLKWRHNSSVIRSISEIILWISGTTVLLLGSQIRWVQFSLVTLVQSLIYTEPKSKSLS
jgi:hypothetical protein